MPEPTFATVNEMRRRSDEMELEVMLRLRSEGRTWQQIADEMGITRQAVQQRFAYRQRSAQ